MENQAKNEGTWKKLWNSEFGKLIKEVTVGVGALAIGVMLVGAAV